MALNNLSTATLAAMSGSTPVIDGFAHSNPGYTLAMCGLYMSLGVLAICANLLNIYIILTNRDLRAKYMFHLAVDFGELVNGVSYILTSIGRGSGVFRNTFTDLITIEQCFFTKYWPVFLIMGTELPSMFTIIISLERICAVHKPGKYNIYYSTNSKRCQIFLVIFLEGLSLGWAALSAKGNKTESTTQHCAIINSTDTVYSTFHFSFITIAYMACLISLVTTYWVHKKHTTTVGVQVGKSSNSMNLEFFIFVTSIQIILVAIPGVVMIGSKHNLWKPNDIVVGLTYSTTGFLSIVHTIINFILRKQFRNQFLHLVSCRFHSSNDPSSLLGKTNLLTTIINRHRVADQSDPYPHHGHGKIRRTSGNNESPVVGKVAPRSKTAAHVNVVNMGLARID